MNSLIQSYSNFRFLVRSVRWVELAICAFIVAFARAVCELHFPLLPVAVLFALGMLWNVAFWYAGRRHLLHEKGPEGARLLVWSWVIADVVTTLLLVHFTGGVSSPFLFFLAFPVMLSTVAVGKPLACYGVAVGSTLGVAALWAMDRAGSIPHFQAYDLTTESFFLRPNTAVVIVMAAGAALIALVYTIFRFRPNFFIFQDSFREGRFRIQSFRAGRLQELRLEDVEAIGPEDLLEEVVQSLTLSEDVVFGAAVVLPAGEDTIGGAPGTAWHHGLTRQRVVSTTLRQVIPTWNEFNAEGSELFRHLRHGHTGDLWEGPFSVLQRDGLFTSMDDADSYLATAISQGGRAVVVLILGLRHPVKDRSAVVLHLLNVAAQLKPLLVAESRLSQMRGELSALHNENEALSRANKMHSDFVSIASHELKTPLTAIGAYTDALMMNADVPEFPERREFLEVIRHETDRLLRMVNRILDFSQIEFGNRSLSRSLVSMADIVDDCLKTMRPQIERRRIVLDLDVGSELPRVEADPDLLKQVVLNLLSNAWKFSPEGGMLHVKARERAATIEVTVRDEGPGIPDSEAEHVFKQFYRIRGENGEAPEGSGLGLTIVRNIVELHGGKVWVDGGEGTGATFTFDIPKEQCLNHSHETVLGDVTRRGEFNHMLRLLVRMVADYMECKIVSVMLLSADRRQLFVQAAYGLEEKVVKGAAVPLGDGVAGRVAASGRPLLVENVEDARQLGIPNNPQYETCSLISVPLVMDGKVVGVVNCNNKTTGEPFYPDDLSLLITLTDKVTHSLSRALSFEDSRGRLERTVDALQALVDMRAEGSGTTRRAVRLALELGRRMGLSRAQLLSLQYACVIHDVGMVHVDPDILEKSGPLSEEERLAIRSHPSQGVDLVEPFLSADELDEIIRYHHERVDGTGYPSGLVGEHIPLPARIVSIVDAYDAMTSPRPWRRKLAPARAAEELVGNAGSQFDPEIVQLFLDVLAESGELNREDYSKLKEGEPWLHPVS